MISEHWTFVYLTDYYLILVKDSTRLYFVLCVDTKIQFFSSRGVDSNYFIFIDLYLFQEIRFFMKALT
jgi:hypothetical protein